jgi:hypothetical protein
MTVVLAIAPVKHPSGAGKMMQLLPTISQSGLLSPSRIKQAIAIKRESSVES